MVNVSDFVIIGNAIYNLASPPNFFGIFWTNIVKNYTHFDHNAWV